MCRGHGKALELFCPRGAGGRWKSTDVKPMEVYNGELPKNDPAIGPSAGQTRARAFDPEAVAHAAPGRRALLPPPNCPNRCRRMSQIPQSAISRPGFGDRLGAKTEAADFPHELPLSADFVEKVEKPSVTKTRRIAIRWNITAQHHLRPAENLARCLSAKLAGPPANFLNDAS